MHSEFILFGMAGFILACSKGRNRSPCCQAIYAECRRHWTVAAESSDEDLTDRNSCNGEEIVIERPSQEVGSLYRRLTGTQASTSLNSGSEELLNAWQPGTIKEHQFSKLREQPIWKDPQRCNGGGPTAFASVLLNFQEVKDLSDGKHVHGYVIKSGLERNRLLGNLLVQMYVKYGAMDNARALFFEMSERNLSAWNSMVRAYSQFGRPNDAFQLFEQMQNEGVMPNKYVFVSLLSACTFPAALAEGKRLHSRIVDSGYESEVVVGTAFVNMYGKCGNLNDSKMVFDSMSKRDTISWNAVIAVYAQHEEGKEALQLYEQMLQEGIIPNKRTFVSVLDACACQVAKVQGKQMHACIMASGSELDVVVVTALVNMHGKCCNLANACKAFAKTDVQDVVLWNTMIAAYIQNGLAIDAFQLFESMKSRGILPDKVTLISTLSACTSKASLLVGKQTHVLIMANGFEFVVDVGNALISMYSKCSSPEDSWNVFSKMLDWDIFSWSSVLGAFAQNGQIKKCLEVFCEMQKEGFVPNKVTFVSIIDVCASQSALSAGKQIHACLAGTGFESDIVVGTALVNMYGKCGSLEYAWALFTNISERDLVSWNAMIAAYAQNSQIKDALQLVDQLQLEGLRPDKITFTTILSACTSQAALAEGKQIQALIMASELKSEAFLGIALVNMYSKCCSLEDARSLFDKMPEKDTLVWNAMISACARNGQATDALRLSDQMQLEGEIFNNTSFDIILSVCTSQRAIEKGKQIHALIVGSGLELDTVACTPLVHMYGKFGILENARSIFDEIVKQDAILWNTMISAYIQNKYYTDAFLLFNRMWEEGHIPGKDTFVSILFACSRKPALTEGKVIHICIISNGFELDAAVVSALLSMYENCVSLLYAIRMFDNIPELSKSILVSILCACARRGALSEGKQLHAQIVGFGYESDVLMGNVLINMYGKCSSLEDAQIVFQKLSEPDVVSWTSIISAYAQSGMGENALRLFNKMQLKGVIPNKVTFVSILSACSHTGMVEEGCHRFLSMNRDHAIAPIMDHYHCMIDLLGRAGRLKEAESLINSMPFQANAISWITLLSACRSQIDVWEGQHAASKVFELDPENATPYVMLSNIYAVAGREDATQLKI